MDDAVTEANTSRPGSPVPPLPELPSARPTYRFTWDPALRRSGPGSVSEATDNRGDDYASPRDEVFPLNNVSSLTLALPHDWSSSKHGFNAISTVLNNPHKRAAPPKAHSSLPAVAAAELPRVRRKDFEPYLNSIASEWERFERSTRLGREGAAQLEPMSHQEAAPQPSSSTLSPGPFTPEFPRTPRTPQPPPGKVLPLLDIVPPIYFTPSFSLSDPATFALVSEALDDSSSLDHDPASIAHSLPLLEKLSHYADVVEQHLVREIAQRSASFFAALTNLQDLQTESGACLDRIASLRAMLKEVDERTARRGLEMVRLESRLANLERVEEGVRVVRDVGEMVGVAGGLVHAGEWGEALGVIEELDALWEAPPPPTPAESNTKASNGHAATPEAQPQIPLSSLQAFSSLPAHLRELTLEIATSLTSDLVSVLKSDLHERIETTRGSESEKTNELLRDRLKPLLQGLVRTQGVQAALDSWREVVMGEVRGAVKRHLPSSEDADEEEAGASKKGLTERSASLANQLRDMSHEEFLRLLQHIYSSLMRCIQGVQAQNQTITALLESIAPDSDTDTSTTLASTLSSAAELAHTRTSKLLLTRADQHAQLPLPSFHALFATTWTFVLACEVLSRRMIVGLRGAVVGQAKAFLVAFHAERIGKAARLVEEEVWAQVDVPAEVQRVAGLLVDAAMHDPGEFVLAAPESLEDVVSVDKSEDAGGAPLSPPSTPPQGTPPPPLAQDTPGKQLRIEERPYFVVGATLQVLVVLLADYVRLIVNLPLLTTDAMGRVIEFLKSFNSRTCQVVLGAGAMRSAGLKNITAKHLALASQSLSIGIALIPYIRETFRRHLSATQAVMLVEFDKLKRDYQEHQNEIHAKLVVIMGDRLGVHCKTLQEVKWNEPAPAGGTGVNSYMEILVKETVTLHKVLAKYLAAPAVELVMTQVLAAINHRLSEEYGGIELDNQTAKDRLLADTLYLHDKMSGLRHVGAPGGMLETVVREKAVRGVVPASQKPQLQSRLSEKMAAAVGRREQGESGGGEDSGVTATNGGGGSGSGSGVGPGVKDD